MTGVYPQRLGHGFEDFLGRGSTGLDPALHTALPERLRRAGYRTACYGKWNLQGHRQPGRSRFIPNAHGCEHWVGTRRNHDYFSHVSPLSGEPDLFEDGRPIEREGDGRRRSVRNLVAPPRNGRLDRADDRGRRPGRHGEDHRSRLDRRTARECDRERALQAVDPRDLAVVFDRSAQPRHQRVDELGDAPWE